MAHKMGVPVVMDMGGTDAPLDINLLPYVSMIAPNETELTFISGVETQENGSVSKVLVRKAVETLKSKCAAHGNSGVEVLVTLGSLGSMFFGASWVNNGSEDD